jgi:uncharacterized protein YcfJ
MDNRRSTEVLNVEQLTPTVRTPRQVCSDEIVTSQAPTNVLPDDRPGERRLG